MCCAVLASNFIKSNTPPWMFFRFFKLYKWNQIAQNIFFTENWVVLGKKIVKGLQMLISKSGKYIFLRMKDIITEISHCNTFCDTPDVYLQTDRNSLKSSLFLREIQTIILRILNIKNKKFSGYYFILTGTYKEIFESILVYLSILPFNL